MPASNACSLSRTPRIVTRTTLFEILRTRTKGVHHHDHSHDRKNQGKEPRRLTTLQHGCLNHGPSHRPRKVLARNRRLRLGVVVQDSTFDVHKTSLPSAQ